MASACANVAGTNRSQLSLVSEGELAAVAARQYQQILKEEKLSKDAKSTQMVRRVGERIKMAAEKYLAQYNRQGEIANYRWEFNLIDSPEANAFCLPGGKVAVYSGILPVCQGEAGLATVIGHEVAHAIAHHGAERASQQMMAGLGATILDIGLGLGGASQVTSDVVMTAYGLGSQVGVLLPFSRTHEAEADRIGLSLMAIAGYDPKEAVGFWERMSQNKGGSSPMEFLSTHPADRTRIQNIKNFLPEAEARYTPFKGSTSGSGSRSSYDSNSGRSSGSRSADRPARTRRTPRPRGGGGYSDVQ
jgi:predicted Zn-dependent protease